MKDLTKSNVFKFFENTANYNEGIKICQNLMPYQNARETLHEVYINLQTKDTHNVFPEEHRRAIFFLVVVIKNHRKNRQKRKLPRQVEYDDKYNYMDEPTPDVIAKLDKLNELINKEENFFTEEQMRLWAHLYKTHSIEIIAKAMRKSLPKLYSLKGKMKEKIRKHFTLLDLFE